jgi:nitrate reductase alpha subunit
MKSMATDKAHRQNGDGRSQCDCCGKPLHWGRTVWLESDQRIDCYHDYGTVPSDQSNGWFPFGPACAARLIREARAAAKAAGVYIGRRRIGKLAQCELRMAMRLPSDCLKN